MGRITEIVENGEQQPIEDVQDETVVIEETEQEPEQQAEEPQAEESEEITVSIGEEPVQEEQERAPEWVRELRKQHREAQKRIRELEAQVPQQNAPKLAAKPKLEDFDYDTDKFEAALEGWYDQKRKHDEVQAEQQRAVENEQKTWQERLTTYQTQKSSLKVKDFEDAEDLVKESLNVVQQGVILQGAENSALIVYALGKNPKKAQELAAIKDPVKFAFAVAKLEKDLKVSGKRTPPPPEKPLSGGSAPISGSVDSTLDRLRAEAEKTGDYTKVSAYKRQLRAKSN